MVFILSDEHSTINIIFLQLLELQSRFGMDARFKLDGRFADGAGETKSDSENEDSELAKQMSILEKVVGPMSKKSKAQDKYDVKEVMFIFINRKFVTA
jgi:hypothetical protein